MKLAEFGGANSDNYSIGTITGWLEALIRDEEDEEERRKFSKHREARLDLVRDALQALYDADDPRAIRAKLKPRL